MNIISINNLKYKKQNKEILSIDNLVINKGEYITLLGQNGSGKSSLAYILTNIIEEYEGELIINQSKGIGMVFENPDDQIISSIVEEDIAFGLQNKQIPREEMEIIVDKVLKQLNIYELKYRNVNTLSSGQKQKIALASLIALDFDIYIFDEVTSMLDPESKKLIRNEIFNLHKQGKTIIEITHFPEEMKLSQRSIILNKGKIIFDGKTLDLMENKSLLKNNRLF